MHHRLPVKTGSNPPKPVPPHQSWGYFLTRTMPGLPAVPATDQIQGSQSSLATVDQTGPISARKARVSQCLHRRQANLWFYPGSGAQTLRPCGQQSGLHGGPALLRHPAFAWPPLPFSPAEGVNAAGSAPDCSPKIRSNQTLTYRVRQPVHSVRI